MLSVDSMPSADQGIAQSSALTAIRISLAFTMKLTSQFTAKLVPELLAKITTKLSAHIAAWVSLHLFVQLLPNLFCQCNPELVAQLRFQLCPELLTQSPALPTGRHDFASDRLSGNTCLFLLALTVCCNCCIISVRSKFACVLSCSKRSRSSASMLLNAEHSSR